MSFNKLIAKQGNLLLSEPFLNSDPFKRAVILLAEHDANGSLGFILNKPIEMDINEAIDDFPEYDGPLYYGGPVGLDKLYYIHTMGDKIPESQQITDQLYWGGDFDIVKSMIISGSVAPDQLRFFIGYAGWAAQQLDEELKEKSWIIAKGELKFILSENTEHLWADILKTMGTEYSIMANFPEDPSLN